MLVLSRKPGESITVNLPSGEEIVFEILDVKGYRVSIGIDAPRELRVRRTELVPIVSTLEYTKRGAR